MFPLCTAGFDQCLCPILCGPTTPGLLRRRLTHPLRGSWQIRPFQRTSHATLVVGRVGEVPVGVRPFPLLAGLATFDDYPAMLPVVFLDPFADRRGVEPAGYDCVPRFFFCCKNSMLFIMLLAVMGAALQPPVACRYWAPRSSGKSLDSSVHAPNAAAFAAVNHFSCIVIG